MLSSLENLGNKYGDSYFKIVGCIIILFIINSILMITVDFFILVKPMIYIMLSSMVPLFLYILIYFLYTLYILLFSEIKGS